MSKDASRVPGIRCTGRGGGTPSGPTGPLLPESHSIVCCQRIKSPFEDLLHRQRGRDSNPRLTFLPATAFKAVPIGHSGTPPGAPAGCLCPPSATALNSSLLERGQARRLNPALGLDDPRGPTRVVRHDESAHQQPDDQAEHHRIQRRQQDVRRERTRRHQ